MDPKEEGVKMQELIIKEGETVRHAIHRIVDEAFEGEIDDITIKTEDELILTPQWDNEKKDRVQEIFQTMPFKRLELVIVYATRDEWKDEKRE